MMNMNPAAARAAKRIAREKVGRLTLSEIDARARADGGSNRTEAVLAMLEDAGGDPFTGLAFQDKAEVAHAVLAQARVSSLPTLLDERQRGIAEQSRRGAGVVAAPQPADVAARLRARYPEGGAPVAHRVGAGTGGAPKGGASKGGAPKASGGDVVDVSAAAGANRYQRCINALRAKHPSLSFEAAAAEAHRLTKAGLVRG